ncbi:NADH-flavin reductase [Pseudonocardia sp. CNS-139]|nr:NADH-flavin reductase [Pseudonocardia sp. CNS-139]
MELTVFGATGGTGRLVVEQALAAGHDVTAVVRDRARLPVPDQERLHVAVGPVTDRPAVLAAVTGANAVVDALGANDTGPTSIRVDAARVIVPAMREAGVTRLVVVSAAGFHTTGDGPFVRWGVKPVLGRFLRHSFADMAAMEKIVRASGLDWTIVLPPRLTNGPRTGRFRSAVDRSVRGSFSITRADLADAVLQAVTDDRLRHAEFSVAAA